MEMKSESDLSLPPDPSFSIQIRYCNPERPTSPHHLPNRDSSDGPAEGKESPRSQTGHYRPLPEEGSTETEVGTYRPMPGLCLTACLGQQRLKPGRDNREEMMEVGEGPK